MRHASHGRDRVSTGLVTRPAPVLQVGLSAARLKAACAAAAGSKYMVCGSGSRRVDVVIARDARDSDVLQASAAHSAPAARLLAGSPLNFVDGLIVSLI